MSTDGLKILFADDEKSLQQLIRLEISAMGHTVTVCSDGLSAIEALKKEEFDVLLLDLDMPGASGLEVIQAAHTMNPTAKAVILTGKGSLQSAVAGIREKIFDYLTKPCRLAEIEDVLNRIAEEKKLTQKVSDRRPRLERVEVEQRLVGESGAMKRVHQLIDKIAPTNSTVVILGETGTGKELAAREVHAKSARAEKPFVAVNCGALPENLIESELFGHKKGSFTGADSQRVGLLEVADKGTLFLDEIGELPKGVQSKLLRFLESGEVRRIGENSSRICDVRVICATLRNLEEMVAQGGFRQDLWFRINTFEIQLPPLRQRLEDLPELIVHLTSRYKKGAGLKSIDDIFTPEAFELLRQFDWPGNIRQLANVVEHALILTERFPAGPEALPHQFLEKPAVPLSKTSRAASAKAIAASDEDADELMAFDSGKTLRDLENEAIVSALRRNGGNKAKAAEELGISLKTLYNKLNQLQDMAKKTG
ncbi:MAG: sigma-54-dependent Fis family transcriptional regulator [Thermoguttaceae bacterium]|nr:sigma-54-dependent Fis family transcriptional regulator [Thermoguttaceae bacterium]